MNRELVPYDKISFFNRSFWDLWFQKVFRNFASVKYQFMVAFFTIITYGMFFGKTTANEPIISATAGLAFLGGGFLSLATSRIIMRTSLTSNKEDGMDTDS
jgi:hypothetical protein